MESTRIIAVTQARIGSSRLPKKVLLKIGEKSLLDLHLARIKQAKRVTNVMVATTHEPESDKICQIADQHGLSWYQGDLNDVLDRFYQAAKLENADWVVRLTSDCPLIDPELIDQVIAMALEEDLDYCSNILVEDFPDGQDVEVFKMSALKKAWSEATETYQREHVTPYIRENTDFKGGDLFKAKDFPSKENYNKVRMTVDELRDLEMLRWLIDELGTDEAWLTYTKHIIQHADKLNNQQIIRNEGFLKSIKKEY